ncbi:hypothetical protein [Marimonas arenosa]|uniref:Uncharacterized protein n=1 Tax=Marimonas arenosa TaxID=1795305 RepID=A0AAE3WDF4_9RHOB|nr:hypothetical protein [Marimonas arenosa]MDQ2091231.1 hypothetical protein [Marimonas arenosa]
MDETLSVVRQMMQESAKETAVPRKAPRQPEAVSSATMTATAPSALAKTLPELGAADSDEMNDDPAGMDDARGPGLLGRLAALLPRRRRVTDLADLPDDWATRGAEPHAQTQPELPHSTASFNAVAPDRIVDRLKARIASYEPKRKHSAVLLLLAVMIWKPWLIPGLLFLGLWIVLIAYFTLGPDRVTELVLVFWEWFSKRRPETAQRVLERVQRGADRVDGWLTALPESWTDGVYLPDFGRSAAVSQTEAMDADPFDRLQSEREDIVARAGRVPGQLRS